MVINLQSDRKIGVMRGDSTLETLSCKQIISNMIEPLLLRLLDNFKTLRGSQRTDECYAGRN